MVCWLGWFKILFTCDCDVLDIVDWLFCWWLCMCYFVYYIWLVCLSTYTALICVLLWYCFWVWFDCNGVACVLRLYVELFICVSSCSSLFKWIAFVVFLFVCYTIGSFVVVWLVVCVWICGFRSGVCVSFVWVVCFDTYWCWL